MRVSLIVAMASNRVIGIGNRLPWHLPADLKHFKHLTWGKPIIMGRSTYDSIGKPLPGRQNIVISHNRELKITGCDVVNSLEAAIKIAENAAEIMIIGGAQIFQAAIPHAQRLYLTLIHETVAGDTYLPEAIDITDATCWRLVDENRHNADENNPFAYSFLTFDKVSA